MNTELSTLKFGDTMTLKEAEQWLGLDCVRHARERGILLQQRMGAWSANNAPSHIAWDTIIWESEAR